jgi:hypothetical protein
MEKGLSVCPTYAFLQLGHVSLNIPDFLYLCCWVWLCVESSLLMVLHVVYATLTEVFLNSLMINLVYFPKYVKHTHFCLV